VSRVLRAACFAATVSVALIAAIILIPAAFPGHENGGTHRMGLYNAYLFCAIAAPSTGIGSLIIHAVTKIPRARWAMKSAVIATLSGGLWLVLFPFVFFASGGSR
jgi:hypothetical protein